MAELTTTAETTASACCAPEAQATCCEPSAKAECWTQATARTVSAPPGAWIVSARQPDQQTA